MTPRARVELPSGATTEVPLLWDRAEHPTAALALAHGAGAGPEHPFLAGFAEALCARGVTVLRFAFPYLAAGRRMPGPAADAVATWRSVLASLAEDQPDLPIIAAGKSYGGRMASLAAADGEIAPQQLVYLGYPLHAPGRADRPRVEHLPRIVQPQLFVSGTRDPFVDPVRDLEDAVAACADAHLIWIEGGRHSFEVAGRRRDARVIGEELAETVRPWLRAT